MNSDTKKHPLVEAFEKAPKCTGVYIMKTAKKKVIYVGKAKNIKNRIRTYANQNDSRTMIPFLASLVANVEFIVTLTEKEALILENNLIKLYRPRYNIFFRDDRSFFCIAINIQHNFPRISLVRETYLSTDEKSFGPFPSSSSAKETLRFLQSLFPLRTCKDSNIIGRKRPCIEHQIKRCVAPCVKNVSATEYRQIVDDAISFLDGGQKQLVKQLRLRMKTVAENCEFEVAMRLRDQIRAIETTVEKQTVSLDTTKHQDIFGIYEEKSKTSVCVMFMRWGKILGVKNFPLLKTKLSTSATISSVMKLYYNNILSIPNEIIIPEKIDDKIAIQEWLSQHNSKKIKITIPHRGASLKLLELAHKNAQSFFESQTVENKKRENTLKKMQQTLSLSKLPRIIECFDISNISGQHATGSKVNFVNGEPCKKQYRRFKIKTIHSANDYAMMREVIRRRFMHIDDAFPDLVVVDGGKGQLSVAISVFEELNINCVDLIALAKERVGKNKTLAERIYLHGQKNALTLADGAPELLLLMRIRDEAHRFALSYHRQLRENITKPFL
ncbi:MAG: excinuclease ABC subunit UvrC [Deltaproteobacteria bacterium]